jgi:DNA-binding NarL/FixJ family response regulator
MRRVSHCFLIVDDKPLIRIRIRELLAYEYPDAAFTEAGSAEEAAALLPSPQVTAVVLDIHLPGISGIAALPDLRARLPGVPIVVVSAAPQSAYAKSALRAGANAFVAKERVNEELVPVLQALFG